MFSVGPSFFGGGDLRIPAGFLRDSLGFYTFYVNPPGTLATRQSTVTKFSGGSSLFGYTLDDAYICSTTSQPGFDTARLNVGTGDFTIEARVYPTSFGGGQVLLGLSKSNPGPDYSWYLGIFTTGTLWFSCNGGAGLDFKSSNALTLNQWNDVGLSRSGTTWTMYVNGTSTPTTSSQSLDAAIRVVRAGRQFYGYMDHLRLSNIARPLGVSPGFYDVSDPNAILILEFDDT
jgi:hypothetical protein